MLVSLLATHATGMLVSLLATHATGMLVSLHSTGIFSSASSVFLIFSAAGCGTFAPATTSRPSACTRRKAASPSGRTTSCTAELSSALVAWEK